MTFHNYSLADPESLLFVWESGFAILALDDELVTVPCFNIEAFEQHHRCS